MSKDIFNKIENTAVESISPLLSPAYLKHNAPINDAITEHVYNSRIAIANVLNRKDKRKLLVIGPCSIHDPVAAIDYAERLKKLAAKVSDNILIAMRVYFEKPRTTIGWKGLINDPNLDNSCDINKGLMIARKLLLDINKIGLPVATEFLDPVTPEYISDLISWGAIGARTTESQIHRNLASGLSMPIGFKNGTTGNIKIAVDAVYAAYHSSQFLGITNEGIAGIIKTKGNKNTHIILRGGSETGPNYFEEFVKYTVEQLESIKLIPNIMIDCSHGNSNKDYTKQSLVLDTVVKQLSNNYGNSIIGFMVESFIKDGSQPLSSIIRELEYGQSITDSCISWEDTEKLVLDLNNKLK